jgi:arabinosaccharide transport system substrate-binding protein
MLKKTKKITILIFILTAIFAISNFALAAKPKVVFWSYAANNIEEWKKREAAIEKKFNIDLQIEQVAQAAFVQKLQATMMDGARYPDIIEWMIETNKILDANPKKCLVTPLDKYVKKSKIFKNVVPGRIAWTTYGGHVYGLPHDVHPVVLIYNDTLWKSVGVDLAKIETWDQFFDVAQKLTATKKSGKPVHYALPYDPQGLGATMWMIWQQTGAQVLNRKGRPTLNSRRFVNFVKWWKTKIDTGTMCAWDWGNFAALLQNGALASYASPDWWIGQVDAAAKEGKYQFRVRPLPYYKKGGPCTSSWGGTFMAITKLAKNRRRLYKIMEYMQYDKSAVKTRYVNTGMLPPLATVWNNRVFKKPDARFGGQKLGELQTTLAKEMPTMNTGDLFWEITYTDFNKQFTEIMSGRISLTAGLKKAQANAIRRLKRSKK